MREEGKKEYRKLTSDFSVEVDKNTVELLMLFVKVDLKTSQIWKNDLSSYNL